MISKTITQKNARKTVRKAFNQFILTKLGNPDVVG